MNIVRKGFKPKTLLIRDKEATKRKFWKVV